MVTRAKAGIFKPLERMNCHVTTTSPLTRSHVHALRDPNWKEAMLDEYNALFTNGTYKAYLVTNRRSQQHVSRDWTIHQLDVKNAFLHGHLSETVYMHQLPGFVDPNKPDYYSKTDSFLFVFHRGSDIAYLLLYVDDIILTSSSSAFLHRIIASLHSEFTLKDPGSLNYFLGISAQPSTSGLFLSYLAGALQYLTLTRPDISYAVQQLYASSTAQLTAYTDADWAGCPVTLSRCSAEAEYRGVVNVVAQTAWLRNLLLELYASLTIATLVYCDNVSVVYLSTNPIQHQCTKHIEIDIHFVRDYVTSGQVRVLHVPSRFQYADIFTKGLPSALFCDFRTSLNVRSPPVTTVGEY
ncbi:ribonuclease H-like domain-containing protein [Tanacetum coccineum]